MGELSSTSPVFEEDGWLNPGRKKTRSIKWPFPPSYGYINGLSVRHTLCFASSDRGQALYVNFLNDFFERVIRHFISDLAGAGIPMPAAAIREAKLADIDGRGPVDD